MHAHTHARTHTHTQFHAFWMWIYVYKLVFTLDHLFSTSQNGDIGSKSCYYLSTPLDTEHVFTLLYRQFTGSPHKLVKVTFLSSHVGSDKLKKVQRACAFVTYTLHCCTRIMYEAQWSTTLQWNCRLHLSLTTWLLYYSIDWGICSVIILVMFDVVTIMRWSY